MTNKMCLTNSDLSERISSIGRASCRRPQGNLFEASETRTLKLVTGYAAFFLFCVQLSRCRTADIAAHRTQKLRETGRDKTCVVVRGG